MFVLSVLSLLLQQSCKVQYWRLSSGSVNHVEHQTGWGGSREGGSGGRGDGMEAATFVTGATAKLIDNRYNYII